MRVHINNKKRRSQVQSTSLLNQRKGVSPVVATVLLIAMVIVIGLIIFLWFRSLTKDAITKFGGTNIELVCGDVDFTQSYSAGILVIQNFGNVPIYGMKVKISEAGSHTTEDINVLSNNWPTTGLKQGGVFSSVDLSSTLSNPNVNEVLLIPVLLGSSKKGEQIHVCDERFGQEVLV